MRWPTVVAVIALCAGCGGGGGGGSPAAPPAGANAPVVTQQSAGGMWFAPALSGSGPATTLMIAETGDLKISMAPTATSGPAFGYGAVAVIGNRVEGSLETRSIGVAPTASAGAGLHCTVSGTVSTRVSLQLTTDCTDAAGATTTTSIGFMYDPRYETDSSLAAIAGNYNFPANIPLNTATNSLNINGDGTLFGVYDNGPRCTLNGTVSIIHPDFNLYRFEVLFSSCTRLASQFEGARMTGLATRNVPGQKAGAFLLVLTAVINGRLEFASVVYEPV